MLPNVTVGTHTMETIPDPWRKHYVMETFCTILFVNGISDLQLNSIFTFQGAAAGLVAFIFSQNNIKNHEPFCLHLELAPFPPGAWGGPAETFGRESKGMVIHGHVEFGRELSGTVCGWDSAGLGLDWSRSPPCNFPERCHSGPENRILSGNCRPSKQRHESRGEMEKK